jgi:hypothetical protein
MVEELHINLVSAGRCSDILYLLLMTIFGSIVMDRRDDRLDSTGTLLYVALKVQLQACANFAHRF